MRGSGLAAFLLLLIIAAAAASCSAKPASLEWPRGSTAPAVDYNQLAMSVDSVTDVGGPNTTGVLVLRVVDFNGTAVANATVYAFSSGEVVFDAAKQSTDENGVARFAFSVAVEPYAGMSVIASAMKANHTDASILVPIVEETPEPPVQEEAATPKDGAEGVAMAAAGVVGIISIALYLYWNRGL
ncbi:MAG: hypothetical protein V1934_00355 [Methanobacteriota archaeon]